MSLEGLYHDDEDTVDLSVLFTLVHLEQQKGKTNKEIAEKLDCPIRTVEEAIKYRKKLYPEEK